MQITTFDPKKGRSVRVGDLDGGVFIKKVKRAKHYLRVVSGYAIQEDAVQKIMGKCSRIRFVETDTGNIFNIPFASFLLRSRIWEHGHGKQRTISEKFFDENKIPQD